MKILVVSDTHGKNENYLKVLEKVKDADMVLHCGDVEGSEFLISKSCGCECHIVMGNNDFFSTLPREEELTICGQKALITHGHYYYVSMGAEMITQEARARGYRMAFFGHTHKPYLDLQEDLLVMNPGSLSYPRQDGRRPSYGIVEIAEDGTIRADIHYLK